MLREPSIIFAWLFLCFQLSGCNVFQESYITLPTIKHERISVDNKTAPSYNDIILYVPLDGLKMVLLYELISHPSTTFPVFYVDGSGRKFSHEHNHDCLYTAVRIDRTLRFTGHVSVCDNTVQGILPINESYYGHIYPANPPNKENNGEHIMNIIPATINITETIRMHKDYLKKSREPYTGENIQYAMDIAEKHLQRRKRSNTDAGKARVNLDSPFNTTTTTGPFVLKLYAVADSEFLSSHYFNRISTITAIQQSIAFANMAYRMFGLKIILAGFEIWETNPVGYELTKYNGDRSLEVALNVIADYRKTVNMDFHCIHLFTAGRTMNSNNQAGVARYKSICITNFCATVSFKKHSEHNTVLIGLVLTHELSHTFGLEHVEVAGCTCKEHVCVMSSVARNLDITQMQWSPCSVKLLTNLFDKVNHCLRLKKYQMQNGWLIKNRIPEWKPLCGNNLQEEGEGCDCGGRYTCRNDLCCNPETCQLYANATCYAGQCCDKKTCTIMKAGSVCRAKSDDKCDLPEYCDGTSASCPINVHVSDAIKCRNDSYCMNGVCPSSDAMCKYIYGPEARDAGDDCYEMNGKYSLFGLVGCRYQSNTNPLRYTVHLCKSLPDYRCGRLMCLTPNGTKPIMDYGEYVHRKFPTDSKSVCNIIQLKPLRSLDIGISPNGISCYQSGVDDHLCYNGYCMNSTLYQPNKTCHNGGIVNSNGNCHCPIGYGPPDCKTYGPGGSVDSGPASDSHEERSRLFKIILPILIVLFLIGVALVLMITFKQKLTEKMRQLNCLSAELKRPQIIAKYAPASMLNRSKTGNRQQQKSATRQSAISNQQSAFGNRQQQKSATRQSAISNQQSTFGNRQQQKSATRKQPNRNNNSYSSPDNSTLGSAASPLRPVNTTGNAASPLMPVNTTGNAASPTPPPIPRKPPKGAVHQAISVAAARRDANSGAATQQQQQQQRQQFPLATEEDSGSDRCLKTEVEEQNSNEELYV